MNKRFKLIACKVLTREIGLISATCPNFLDITWLRQGYHNEPDVLRKMLQHQIDLVDEGDDPCSCSTGVADFDAILIGYGLCSNGVIGISSKKYPIIIPKAHDCITLFLGSKERYRTLFDSQSGGIYWYTPGWIENSIMPSPEREAVTRAIYVEHYGEDNADYLMEQESGWLKDYNAAAYIKMPGNYPDFGKYTKECADYYNWGYLEHIGDHSLLKKFVDGDWNSKDFLVIPPEKKATPSFDESIIKIEE